MSTTLLIEVEVEKTTGKFVAKSDLIAEVEDALGGTIDVENSSYDINGVNEHACAPVEKSPTVRQYGPTSTEAVANIHDHRRQTGWNGRHDHPAIGWHEHAKESSYARQSR
jgi:hypothetical protein